MATLLKVLNNLPIPNRRGVLHFASELRARKLRNALAVIAVVGFAALFAFVVSVYEYGQASQHLKLANTELDRANKAVAQ
jgi:hypothetical protein